MTEVVNSCSHLSSSQKRDLKRLLQKFEILFNGKLKTFPNEQIHLELDPTVPAHRAQTYPVPPTQMDVFKKKLVDRQNGLQVLLSFLRRMVAFVGSQISMP